MIFQGNPQTESEEDEILREKERHRKRDFAVNFPMVPRFQVTMSSEESFTEALSSML